MQYFPLINNSSEPIKELSLFETDISCKILAI